MQEELKGRGVESGVEVILDNGKLILAFILLIAICGSFFVIGFIEGRRQNVMPGMARGSSVPVPEREEPRTRRKGLSDSDAVDKAADTTKVRQQLAWYENVNKRSDQWDPTVEGPATQTTSTTGQPEVKTRVDTSDAVAAATAGTLSSTYSVQVGAFRMRQEAEAKAEMLKSKGYASVIEPGAGPDPLYLLKVGKFQSRAEAAMMQLRLKRDGFATFIKTN